MAASKQDLSRFSVLIVDDVPLNLTLVEKMIGRFGFDVRTAYNGLECMKEIIARKPDLILLDLMMPSMDGFEVITRIRENPDWAGIKIVVLSALNSNEDIVKAYSMGAQDFITKPTVLDKLTNSVAKQLGIPLA
ncbi:MAG: response regulator [Bacteroidales bacterium]|nr:response regulator [Bacteroidales bacterium]